MSHSIFGWTVLTPPKAVLFANTFYSTYLFSCQKALLTLGKGYTKQPLNILFHRKTSYIVGSRGLVQLGGLALVL